MSKNRIYGEDVVVRLLSSDGLTPYILEFDEIQVSDESKNRSYKAIGKKISTNQCYDTGYKIVLSRTKRDNQITSLLKLRDSALNRGLPVPTFTVEKITTHTYSSLSINPLQEFGQSVISTAIPSLPLGLDNIANQVGNAVNSAISTATSAVGNLLNLPAFREVEMYNNCTLVEGSSSDKPKENSMQTIVLYSTDLVLLNDKNMYDNMYINSSFNSQVQAKMDKVKIKDDNILNKALGVVESYINSVRIE